MNCDGLRVGERAMTRNAARSVGEESSRALVTSRRAKFGA